tara:strand:- start:350 stop:1396 length:1047 start_codon:yes stop_codon:yes gene_type:complete
MSIGSRRYCASTSRGNQRASEREFLRGIQRVSERGLPSSRQVDKDGDVEMESEEEIGKGGRGRSNGDPARSDGSDDKEEEGEEEEEEEEEEEDYSYEAYQTSIIRFKLPTAHAILKAHESATSTLQNIIAVYQKVEQCERKTQTERRNILSFSFGDASKERWGTMSHCILFLQHCVECLNNAMTICFSQWKRQSAGRRGSAPQARCSQGSRRSGSNSGDDEEDENGDDFMKDVQEEEEEDRHVEEKDHISRSKGSSRVSTASTKEMYTPCVYALLQYEKNIGSLLEQYELPLSSISTTRAATTTTTTTLPLSEKEWFTRLQCYRHALERLIELITASPHLYPSEVFTF